MTTQQPIKSCLSRQLHLESCGGAPRTKARSRTFHATPLGRVGILQSLAGSEDCPLRRGTFTIIAPKRGISLGKAERRCRQYQPFSLQEHNLNSVLAAGTSDNSPCALDSASHPINLDTLRLPFPSLTVTLTARDEFTSQQCQRKGVSSVI